MAYLRWILGYVLSMDYELLSMECNLLSADCGLLWAIAACYCGQLGFPGAHVSKTLMADQPVPVRQTLATRHARRMVMVLDLQGLGGKPS